MDFCCHDSYTNSNQLISGLFPISKNRTTLSLGFPAADTSLKHYTALMLANVNLLPTFAAGAYVTDLERIRQNYGEWDRIVIVQGSVPACCKAVDAEAVEFLHLDMNCAYPEVEAL